MQLSVKDVKKEVFKEFKAESVRKGLKIGESLTFAMKTWLDEQEMKKQKLRFLDLKSKDWGKGTERISEEADDVLYK